MIKYDIYDKRKVFFKSAVFWDPKMLCRGIHYKLYKDFTPVSSFLATSVPCI